MLRIKLMEMSHFTVEEAAKEIGVSVQRVRAIISSGMLNGHKRGGVWFVSAADVKEFAQKDRKAGRPRVTWESLEVRDLTPEEEDERAQKERERSKLAVIRADYEWFKACESMPLDILRENAANDSSDEHQCRRSKQAMIVLESREKLNS
jgi:excisionase family DNA binding protein